MKITAGLGLIEDYIPFVKAGADEVFCGYVPNWWNEKYGTLRPVNRREVLYYNVQVGGFEELKILAYLKEEQGKDVSLAMNALYYTKDQYKEMADIIVDCMRIGFKSFIIADPMLIFYLREQNIHCHIHVSGEMSEVNHLFLKTLGKENSDIHRVIFHRKNTIRDMEYCIQKSNEKIREYEAFVLNERCHYTGAYCNSLHCDELEHLCKLPYILGNYGPSNSIEENGVWEATGNEIRIKSEYNEGEDDRSACEKQEVENEYRTGQTGCGLCALKELKEAGITHLKLVGRGNYPEYMLKDIRNLKEAIAILEQVEKEKAGIYEFKKRIKSEIFNGKCSGNCYYL